MRCVQGRSIFGPLCDADGCEESTRRRDGVHEGMGLGWGGPEEEVRRELAVCVLEMFAQGGRLVPKEAPRRARREVGDEHTCLREVCRVESPDRVRREREARENCVFLAVFGRFSGHLKAPVWVFGVSSGLNHLNMEDRSGRTLKPPDSQILAFTIGPSTPQRHWVPAP